MKQANTKKRSAGVAGVKALIAAGSVAATLVGWALLPSNDPQPAGATAPADQQQPPALSVPGTGDSQQVPADPFQVPNTPSECGEEFPETQTASTGEFAST